MKTDAWAVGLVYHCWRCKQPYRMGREYKTWCEECRAEASVKATERIATEGWLKTTRTARRRMLDRMEHRDQTRFAARLEDGLELQGLTEYDGPLWWELTMFQSVV